MNHIHYYISMSFRRSMRRNLSRLKQISHSYLFRNDSFDYQSSPHKAHEKWVYSRNDSALNSLFFKWSILVLLILGSYFGYSQNAKRIISLAPSITENVYLIGAEDKLVGCTSYCTQAIADGVEQVGSTIDVNIEKILTLQPDLVLTMLMTKSQDLEAIRKLGIKVEVIPTPKNFEEVCDQTEHIAQLVGYENETKQNIQEIKIKVDSLKQVCNKTQSKQKIFFQIGSNPVFTVLPNTFMDDFILFCNGENIANEMTKGTITRESVLVKNPDVIIIATMGGFGAEEMKTWQGYNGLKAAENKKIFLVDSETSCSPTPDNFLKAFTDIVQFLTR